MHRYAHSHLRLHYRRRRQYRKSNENSAEQFGVAPHRLTPLPSNAILDKFHWLGQELVTTPVGPFSNTWLFEAVVPVGQKFVRGNTWALVQEHPQKRRKGRSTEYVRTISSSIHVAASSLSTITTAEGDV